VLIPPGTYTVSAALRLESRTRLEVAEGAVIRLADHAGANSGVFLLTNDDPAGGNENIHVEGGIWDGNCAHNPRGEDGDMDGYTGTAINFVNVKGLVARDLTVRNPEGFSLRLGEVEDFRVEDIRFDHTVIRPNQDGVHVGGHSSRGLIRNLRALTPRTTNDDMVALNADDDVERVLNLGMKRGPIRDIAVDGLSADDTYTFLRLLSVDQPIENITVRNVSGGCRFYAVNMNNWRFPVGVGNIRNVRMRDFSVHKMDGGELAQHAEQIPLVGIRLAADNLLIEGFRRAPTDEFASPTLVIDNGRENRVHLQGGDGRQTEDGLVVDDGGFSRLELNLPQEPA